MQKSCVLRKGYVLGLIFFIVILWPSFAKADFPLTFGAGQVVDANHSHAYNSYRTAMRTIDKSGMVPADGNTHDYNPDNMWYSGTVTGGLPGEPWVKYKFNTTYYLTRLWVWNFNQNLSGDIFGLKYGLKHIKIEYSIDGADWSTFMNGSEPNVLLEQASGSNSYEPNAANKINLNSIIAKYIRISPVGGAGEGNFDVSEHLERYGLSEVRFYASGTWVDYRATNPTPGNTSTISYLDVNLYWTPGITAVNQDLYFGTDPCSMTKIADNLAASVSSYPLGILGNNTYYWRLDTFDGSNVITGALWRFQVAAKASSPSPVNGFEIGTEGCYLGWTAADGAIGQKVYFGTDADALSFIANVDADTEEYPTGELEDKTTYYWRIDTVVSGGGISTGDVWSLSTKFRLPWIQSVGQGRGIIAADANIGLLSLGQRACNALNGRGMVPNTDMHVPAEAENYWWCAKPLATANIPFIISLDKPYKLEEMWIWNAPAAQALKNVKIEYTVDDVNMKDVNWTRDANWVILPNPDPCAATGDPNLFVFAQGLGSGLPSNLANGSVVDFGGVSARHVRLTAWGGRNKGNYEPNSGTCWGYMLHELRLYCKTPVLYSDVSQNCKVDFNDYATIAGDWTEDSYSVEPELFIDDFESYDPNGDPCVPGAELGWVRAPWAYRECPAGTKLSVTTDIAHGGSKSLKVEYDGALASGLAYHSIMYMFGGANSNKDLRNYKYLEWWQYNATGNDDIKYRCLAFEEWVMDDPWYSYQSITTADIYWCNPKIWSKQVVQPANQWFRVRIDLGYLSPQLWYCDAFAIKCDTTEPGYLGKGVIYYDDVKFFSPHCESKVEGDVTGDCIVDMLDIATMAEEWLLDNID